MMLWMGLMLMAQDVPEPTMVSLTIPAGPCRIVLDGRPVSMAEFRRQATGWKFNEPVISLQPDPKARFACVDRALIVLKTAKLTKLGFVGYERGVDE